MRLSEVQKYFKDTMLDHPKVLDTPPEDFAELFNVGDIPLPERLKVYRNNIIGSLTDVMIASHPLLEKLVGHEFLELMARSFVLENPPTHGCLNMYGAGFDKFIESYELAKALPYLADMAKLEIAMNEAYHAPEDEPLKANELATASPEDLQLKLRQNVQLVSSRYPLDKIRNFCIEDDPDKTMSVDSGGVKMMIYRPELDSVIVKLEDGEYEMLLALNQGVGLNEAVETTLNAHKGFGFQEFLQRHIELETFLALKTNT
ncbi:MAG: DUF2063 domain-containing protein [Micavibrio sp.]|nr:MAG: DUF2063 domain-containing protein [Micavibrio sp.]